MVTIPPFCASVVQPHLLTSSVLDNTETIQENNQSIADNTQSIQDLYLVTTSKKFWTIP